MALAQPADGTPLTKPRCWRLHDSGWRGEWPPDGLDPRRHAQGWFPSPDKHAAYTANARQHGRRPAGEATTAVRAGARRWWIYAAIMLDGGSDLVRLCRRSGRDISSFDAGIDQPLGKYGQHLERGGKFSSSSSSHRNVGLRCDHLTRYPLLCCHLGAHCA